MGKPQPIFEDSDADDQAADAEGLADLDAGRIISHEDMKAWLATWGKPPETDVNRKCRRTRGGASAFFRCSACFIF